MPYTNLSDLIAFKNTNFSKLDTVSYGGGRFYYWGVKES